MTGSRKTATEHTLDINGIKWFYRKAEPMNPPEKPPVVLLHGLPSQSYGWRKVLPALADRGFRAIAPDWPGFGFSDKPDRRTFRYTPDAYIQALADFLAALELSRVYLVVQGFLGSVGLQYALRHRDRIERLAIFNAPIASTARVPWKIKQLGVPLLGEMLTQDPLLVDRTLEGGGGYRVEDADLDVYRRPFLKSSDAGRSLFAVVQNLQLPTVTAEIEAGLKTWTAPTLLAWGMNDPWLPFAMAEATAQGLPHVELVKLEEVGHYPQEDWHEKVNEALIDFLRQQMF
jgi:pimeloyl-ACP methyl ester carboxylesterase